MRLYLDVETTGFSPNNSAIIEIASVLVKYGEIVDKFHSYVAPFDGASISDEALSVNGLSRSRIETFPKQYDVIVEYIKWLTGHYNTHESKFLITAHNAKFDQSFIQMWFNRNQFRNEFQKLFKPNVRCVLSRANERDTNIPVKKNLISLCSFFNIKHDNAHSAMSDTMATIEVDNKLDGIKPVSLRMDDNMSYHDKRVKYLSSKYIIIDQKKGDIFIHGETLRNPNAMEIILEEIYSMQDDSI